jgi:hypothetical protein
MADHEEVLFFPVGTFVAIVTVAVMCLVLQARWFAGVGAVFIAAAASVPFWFMPGSAFPGGLHSSAWGAFLVGLLPSFLCGGMVVWAFRKKRSANVGT